MHQIYIEQAFIDPADQNYLVARIAFDRGLILDGYWSAAQATEKYIKAILLFNGFDALGAHKIVSLFDKLKSDVPLAIIPDNFLPPKIPNSIDGMGFNWGSNLIRHFIFHLDFYGSPDNRYGRNGYEFDLYVLPKLDQLIYFLRRSCRVLNSNDQEYKDIMKWRLGDNMFLERHSEKKKWAVDKDNQLVDDFLKGNFIWQYVLAGGGVQVGMQPMMSWKNSAYHAATNNAELSLQDIVEFNEWLILHVKFSRSDKISIKEEIVRLKNEMLTK